MEIIIGKQGNQKIAITDARVSRKHCKLTEQPDGTFILEDLGSSNGTFVNGSSVIRTHVTRDTVIQLGPELKLKVADLVGIQPQLSSLAPKSQPSTQSSKQEPVPEFSLKTLQYIWDEYQNELDTIKEKQKSINMLRTSAPLFTMGSGALATLAKAADWGNAVFSATTVLTIVGLILMVYAFIKSSNDDSEDRRKAALDRFQTHYVCPNPKCSHTHAQSPKILLQNKTCPYCKCKYKE